MAEVNLRINGNNYGISCDDGQEGRVQQLGQYVDDRLRDIAKSGAASNNSHLLVLTSLVLADEIHELSDSLRQAQHHQTAQQHPANHFSQEDEAQIAHAIDTLASRIENIAGNLQKI